MKKWAVLTVLLYAIILLVLAVPAAWVAFVGHGEGGLFPEAWQILQGWLFWVWFAALVAGQALLLLLPIDISERRLTPRRPLELPIIVNAFFLANLFFAGLFPSFAPCSKTMALLSLTPSMI